MGAGKLADRRLFVAGAGAAALGLMAGQNKVYGQGAPAKLAFVSLPNPLEKCNVIWDASGLGYRVDEYLVSGQGPTFKPATATEAGLIDRPDTSISWGIRDAAYAANLPADFSPRPQTGVAPYTTRIVVYRPRDMKKFSGNVIIEPFHPTGSIEVFSTANRFFLSRGDAVVHIDTPGPFGNLKKLDAERYGPLSMPDRSVFWSSVSQIATLIKTGGPNSPIPAPGRHLYMTGYSGSADTVLTFLSYHHKLTRLPDGKPVFSGYLPMSHIRPVPDIADAVIVVAATQSDMFGATDGDNPTTAAFRHKFNSDVPGARRRRYEVPGAFHAPFAPAEPGMAVPLRNAGDAAGFLACAAAQKWPSNAQQNFFPNRALLEACFHHASRWAEAGVAPPHAPLIETDANDKILTDENGNARGGLRFPDIAVPTDTFVPATRGGTRNCASTGYKAPFSRAKLVGLYGTREKYLALYDTATDKLVKDGYILAEGGQKMKSERRWLAPVF
jgi:hypothetical protein